MQSTAAEPTIDAPPALGTFFPAHVAAEMPALREQDGRGDDAVVYAAFYHTRSRFEWWLLEYEPSTGLGFGFVTGPCPELGYLDLAEMRRAGLQRVRCWSPRRLGALKARAGLDAAPCSRCGDRLCAGHFAQIGVPAGRAVQA